MEKLTKKESSDTIMMQQNQYSLITANSRCFDSH